MLYQDNRCCVLLYNVTKSSKEVVTEPLLGCCEQEL